VRGCRRFRLPGAVKSGESADLDIKYVGFWPAPGAPGMDFGHADFRGGGMSSPHHGRSLWIARIPGPKDRMKRHVWIVLLFFSACGKSTPAEPSRDAVAVDGAGLVDASLAACHACVTDQDCGCKDCGGPVCAQLHHDTFCATPCGPGNTCVNGDLCLSTTTSSGATTHVCTPAVPSCGSDSTPWVCGKLLAPEVSACCTCTGKSCADNGCYGGWWCDSSSCKCQAPPGASPTRSSLLYRGVRAWGARKYDVTC
jgi:hypothetical protein